MKRGIIAQIVVVMALGVIPSALLSTSVSARSTSEVEDALQYGVQTAVGWDTNCRAHLNQYRSARFTSDGSGTLRSSGINGGASYVQDTWLSRRGSGNASVPLAVNYGTTSIPLQINDVIFLCGPLVTKDTGTTSWGYCSTSITGASIVDDESRWVLSANNANDRTPNSIASSRGKGGCMHPSMTLTRRKIVSLEVDTAQTTYKGTVSGGTTELLSRRQDNTRYWLSTPSNVVYTPSSPITSSGNIYIKMTYKSYGGYHSANESAATKQCLVNGVIRTVSDVNRCDTQTRDLTLQIVLLDNYKLNPQISVTPTSIQEGVGGNVSVTPSVNNTGSTATGESINWRVTRFEVSPGGTYTMSSTAAEPCNQLTGEKSGSCTTVKSGSGKFNKGTTQLGAFTNSISSTLQAGTKVCYITSVEKGSSANPTWKHSSIECTTINRIPLVHVLGNDVRVGSGFVDTTDATSKIMGSVSAAGGSLGEYGVIASSSVSGFASSAGAIDGSTASQSSWSGLTFANTFSSTATCAPRYGCFGSVGKIPDAIQFFTNSANSSIIEQCNLGSQNITISSLGSYTCADGHKLNSAAHNTDNYKQSAVLYTSGTVTIDKDIKYTQDSLQSVSQLPQLIIISGNTVINESVQRVDAWLIAKGTLSTCNVNPPLTVSQCNRQLKTNGPIMATQLQLNRTYYNSTTKDAAEEANLNPSTYVWAQQLSSKNGTWRTTYVTELPPRY